MSFLEDLEKLKQLLDAGIITKEEYEKKKQEILFNETEVKAINNTIYNSNLKNNKKGGNGCLTSFVIFFIIIMIASAIISGSDVSTGGSYYTLFEKYNISNLDANLIIETIDKCGYSKYFSGYKISKSVDNEEIEGSIGFELTKGERTIGFVDIKDGKVCLIQYSDKYLFQDGEIKHTLDEYLITNDEKSQLIYKTQEVIKGILTSPSSAKFPWDYDEWKVGKQDGKTIVQGYVDSQNGFGAMVRGTFQVTYTDGIVTSLIFNGEELF